MNEKYQPMTITWSVAPPLDGYGMAKAQIVWSRGSAPVRFAEYGLLELDQQISHLKEMGLDVFDLLQARKSLIEALRKKSH